MTISFPIAWPTAPAPKSVVIAPRAYVGVSRSPFTGDVQAFAHQGQVWQATVSYAPLSRAQAESLWTSMLKLNGREGTFTMGVGVAGTPRGAAAATPGTPRVRGGGQTGQDLWIDGCPDTVSGYLKAGDWLQLGSGSSARLYKQLLDIDTNSAGETMLTLWPKVVTAPADNDPLTVSAPVGLWRMASNEMPASIDELELYGLSFAALAEV